MLAKGTDRHQKLSTDRFDLPGSFRAFQSGDSVSTRDFYGNFLDDVRRFDHAFFGVNAREAANMDPQQRILLELSLEALDDSGYLSTHRREAGDDFGCFIGASFVEYLDNTNAHSPTAYTSTGTIRAFLCGRLSYYYGWSGPAEVIDTACSSSLVAINRAVKAVQNGECKMALTGGVNIMTGMNNFLDLSKAGFLSPTGQCKPFDVSADGYCRSDGAGLVVLKTLKQAVSDGDRILGIIPGVATNQGGLSASITVPSPNAQQRLYRAVLQKSGLQPEDITYVEAHGTGTQAGDPLEIESIRTVFGGPSRATKVHVGSIKGDIGHCETAAGVAGLLKALAMIHYGQLPPLANHHQLNPKIPALEKDNLQITKRLSSWDVPFRAAFVNSYGAAGSNCALICCEMPSREPPISTGSHVTSKSLPYPILLSAASHNCLLSYAQTLSEYLRASPNVSIRDVSFTLCEKRQRHKHYFGTTAESVKELAQQLVSLKPHDLLQHPQVFKPIVLCFSGQFGNKVALDELFYQNFPVFRSYIDACDTELQKQGVPSILPAIFQTEPIQSVVSLQCSIFATQYACAKSWMDAGLKIQAVLGHSIGEFAALAVSGVLSLSHALQLVATRARIIETHWGQEKGAMLALMCSIEDFESISSQLKDFKLEVACYNARTSLVAVGTTAAIEAVEQCIKTEPKFQNIRSQRVGTSHGFHSALIEPILDDLATFSKSLDWNEPQTPIEICTPGRENTK